MQYEKDNNHYLIRIDKDEDLFKSLEQFAKNEKLTAGYLSGIGALKNCELGYYHLETKTYHKKMFSNECELLSLDGNLCIFENRPFLHIHTVLSDENFNCIGGHLFSAQVAVTCEVNFRPLSIDLTRSPNKNIGLNLLDFCKAPIG